jgi:transcriptional regulator with XRE-family HTH domain
MDEARWGAIQTGAAQRLRALRLQANLTQQALADEAGVSRAVVQRIEHGHGSPGVRQLWQIAEVLHVPVAEFLAQPAPPA